MKSKDLLLLWFIIPLLTSCITTGNLRVTKVEVFGPGILAIDSIDTIAIYNRSYDYNAMGLDTFYYKNVDENKMVKDTLIKYKDLSNTCTDALADYLLGTGYFKAVINFRDSMIQPVFAQYIAQRQQNPMNYDACIFLDFIGLQDELITNSSYFDQDVISSFPEFENSTMMETIGTRLLWSIISKNVSHRKPYRRFDNLFYGNSVNEELFGSDENHRNLLKNAAGYLGESFANELLPHSQRASRVYYRSNNPKMLTAEKYLISENYIEAAEIYRRLTNNKNQNIAVKASYNMALICEIEGNLEAAMDWLARSVRSANRFDYHHFSRCNEYITLLKKWQTEIELLNNLIKNNEANATDK